MNSEGKTPPCLFVVLVVGMLYFVALLEWQRVEVQVAPLSTLFVFEAVRGGNSVAENLGDICIDNIHVYPGQCSKLKTVLFCYSPSPFPPIIQSFNNNKTQLSNNLAIPVI